VTSEVGNLSPEQLVLLDRWLPGASVERDHGWGLVATTVLEMTHAGSRFIVKAGGENDHHIAREIHAHLNWLGPWTSRDRAPTFEYGDAAAKLLVTRHLPGDLVLGSEYADVPSTYRQAGELLAVFHAQTTGTDDDYERRENEKALAWLSGPHRIAPDTVEQLRAEIAAWPTPAATLVPTHGDWQPRNWLVHDGVVSVIDFGRAAMRPAMTDFARLAVQDFLPRPGTRGSLPRRVRGRSTRGGRVAPQPNARGHRHRSLGLPSWRRAVRSPGHRMISAALSLS
jgi:hypothetical protein